MELFSHQPLMTAAAFLYWGATFIAFFACIMSGTLKGMWRWCFLIWTLAALAGPMLFSLAPDIMSFEGWYPLILSPLLAFALDRWKKWGLSRRQYLCISLFSLPCMMLMFVLLLIIFVG